VSAVKLPYMPMWIADYLADTTHLDCRQHGAYFLLLCAYWQKQGPLPDNDRHLAAITKSTPHAWRAMRETLAEFFTVNDGIWVHKRVDAELKIARESIALAKNRGAVAANTRWKNRKAKNAVRENNSQNSANSETENGYSSNAHALPEQCLTNAILDSDSVKTLAIASAGPEPGQDAPIVDDGPWDRGVAILAKTGVRPRRARECLGRWVQQHGRDAVTRALDRAESESPAEPIAFLERLLTSDQNGQNETSRARNSSRLGLHDALDAALAQRRAAEPAEAQIGA
jgi:uncharacterized protein YdaU (DUF1376 family)